MRTSAVWVMIAVVGLARWPASLNAAEGEPNRCAHCRQEACCVAKTCQIVCDVKKETKIAWSVECREVCPLLPGHHDSCDDGPPLPRCGHPRTVKILVKKEYQVDRPIYRCVVNYLCPQCAQQRDAGVVAPTAASTSSSGSTSPAPLAPLPPPPQADR